MNQLFADGGVIEHNPSTIAGTWAVRLLAGETVLQEQSGVITLAEAGLEAITNNQTELLAIVRGLALLPNDWCGAVCSDSQNALGRCWWGWKWTNIPPWLHAEYQRERRRLKRFNDFNIVLLDGHPNRAQLAAGIGKRGHLVSEHNVAVDKACGQAAADYLKRLAAQ